MENFEQDLDTQSDWLNEQCTRYAFPGQVMAFVGNSEQLVPTQGMTKRELFAMAAMQALLTHTVRRQNIFQRIALFLTGKGRVPVSYGVRSEIAEISIMQADELLKQLSV